MTKAASFPPIAEGQRRAVLTDLLKWLLGEPEHAADEKPKQAAGIVFVDPDGKVLLIKRSNAEGNYKGHWAIPGGGAEGEETPEQAAKREALEEVGRAVEEAMVLVDRRDTPNGMQYSTFRVDINSFGPVLNEEHTEFKWAALDDLPEPIHPAVSEILAAMRLAADIAVDEAIIPRDEGLPIATDSNTVRSYDLDGRMHVSKTPISKAIVNPYYGREIPGWKKLGLDPERKYKLLRDPVELKKAAPTFNNLPVLKRHVAVSATDHKPDDVIGSTGTDAAFEAPYLVNSLVVWASKDIEQIEEDLKRELSCAYRYRPDMTPGVYEGEAYDGVMRDIVGNHLAVVASGRAGPDVLVQDADLDAQSWLMIERELTAFAA